MFCRSWYFLAGSQLEADWSFEEDNKNKNENNDNNKIKSNIEVYLIKSENGFDDFDRVHIHTPNRHKDYLQKYIVNDAHLNFTVTESMFSRILFIHFNFVCY